MRIFSGEAIRHHRRLFIAHQAPARQAGWPNGWPAVGTAADDAGRLTGSRPTTRHWAAAWPPTSRPSRQKSAPSSSRGCHYSCLDPTAGASTEAPGGRDGQGCLPPSSGGPPGTGASRNRALRISHDRRRCTATPAAPRYGQCGRAVCLTRSLCVRCCFSRFGGSSELGDDPRRAASSSLRWERSAARRHSSPSSLQRSCRGTTATPRATDHAKLLMIKRGLVSPGACGVS
jgi:hypothetical protein